MSLRTQNDTVIDDDDEFCPLCIEEFDLSDKNFKPCPCGYQICQFCYNNIKTHSEEGRCPNCRRVYDENTIQYRAPDADELKADLALKHRKAAAAKKKEQERREIEASSRKNLAGVRVVQKNLVYIIGLNPTIRDESQLLQTLRGDQYFGQYGEIEKIVVSKAKPGGNPNQGIGVYVTFARKSDAASCIAVVDGSTNGDRILRAQYGTTKYCSSFLRNEQCNNRNCTFLHETGEDSDSFSRQDLSSMNTISSQRPHPSYSSIPPSQSRAYQQSCQPGPSAPPGLHRQSNKDEGNRQQTSDSTGLPSSASWANKENLVQRTRRSSMAASRGTPSPKYASATVTKSEEARQAAEKRPEQAIEASRQNTPTPGPSNSSPTQPVSVSRIRPPASSDATTTVLDNLLKAINSPEFRFQFSPAGLPADELAYIENYPSLIDPYGGVKRRAMREKAELERVKQDAEAKMLQANQPEEENLEGGSSQLGGEPEDSHPGVGSTGRSAREQQAIQPPSHQAASSNSAIGSPVAAGRQFQSLNVNGRALSSLQQQQLMLLKSANTQQSGLLDQLHVSSNNGYDHNPLSRSSAFQNQMPPMGSMTGHTRQSSRFSFPNESNTKASSHRLLNQQTAIMQASNPNPMTASNTQHGLGSHYFTSGVQGPPPGLKTAGTPPVSGGGMFAQGHGFTSTMNNNLGLTVKQDGNADLMRELMRSRNGTSGIGVQGLEATKREYISSFIHQHNTPPPLAPVSGLLNSLYGPNPGFYQDPGPQKQKKRGKKHRHANTSSGGGGVVDLADPSILQARMHQNNATAVAGQGLYGSQGQVDEDFPPLAPPKSVMDDVRISSRSRFSTGSPVSSFGNKTPSVPPGLPLPHGHPTTSLINESSVPCSPSPSKSPITMQPAIAPPPGLTPPRKSRNSIISRDSTPAILESPALLRSVSARNQAEVSSGSPKSKNLGSSSKETRSSTSSKTAGRGVEDPAPIKAGKNGAREHHGKPKPIKLDISFNHASREISSPSHSSVPYQLPPLAASITSSRPNTPASRISDSPAPRQPRVLRVVDTPKSETLSIQPPSAASGSVTAGKQRSRRPSISSISRPATPAEVGSEYDLYTSASASRANSPPLSRIGSAPVRAMSKNQVKKQRKLKAEQAEAKKEDDVVVTPVDDSVQAPILGRKRKTKKPSKRGVDVIEDGQKTPSIVNGEEQDKISVTTTPKQPEAAPTSLAETEHDDEAPEVHEPWRSNNTLQQLLVDSEESGAAMKDLFLERTAPIPTILAQLFNSGELDLHIHPLFNPPNLNQRMDMKCNADDYEYLKRPIELTEEHRRMLLRGEPVRINGGSDLLKHRCLITAKGCILRHLSADEEDHYIALEKSLIAAADAGHGYPVFIVTEPDTTNRGGGLDALFATPEKFNIRWVDDDASRGGLITGTTEDPAILSNSSNQAPAATPPNVFSALEADSARTSSWAITNSTDPVNVTAPPRSLVTTKAIVTGATLGIGLEELMNVPDSELRSMIENAQRDLEVSRKDVDAVDKKVTALVKRNKKLVQQALSAALEFVASSDTKTPT
ncbi:transcriptional repressor general negative regulator of transcription subunit 4 [Ophidiomyces ophidiicola]|nr:transcriptional repressor general negative regulator of transcription subunit 4 [Ophidiomyces ophidiicola]